MLRSEHCADCLNVLCCDGMNFIVNEKDLIIMTLTIEILAPL